jgi:uncharacterized protein (TIGR03067 family)
MQDPVKRVLKKMAGTWQMVSLVVDGRNMLAKDDGLERSAVIKEDVLTVIGGEQGVRAALKINPGKEPREIDVIFTGGPSKGETLKGVYKLEGDYLTIGSVRGDANRPTDFTSKPGSGISLIVYKRQKREGEGEGPAIRANDCSRAKPVVTTTEATMRPQPLIAVTDVEASSRWYQHLLGCRSDHGGKEYERLVSGDELSLQLHSFEVDHHHGPIANPDDKPYGNGVLLCFEIDDFDAAVARSEELRAVVVMGRHRNPPDGDGGPNHWEIWLRDPDGYTVVLASPDGTAG